MRKIVIRAALGLSIIGAGVAMVSQASAAQHRLQNKANRSMYLGVQGGAVGPHNPYVPLGMQIVVWQIGGDDQKWNMPDENGYGPISNFYITQGGQACLAVQGNSHTQGANLVVGLCGGQPEQTWQIFPAYKFGKGADYNGCYIIYNTSTGMAAGVSGGNGNVKNGGKVIQWPSDKSDNQFWCEV